MEPVDRIDFGDRSCADGVTGDFRRALERVEPGEVVEVVVREPGARADLPAMARMLGHEIVASEDAPEGLRLHVRRGS